MDHFEMVEKLRERARVSYEDAKAALVATDWDLLDAVVYLEKEGKVAPQDAASYSTREEPRPEPAKTTDTRGAFARLFDLVVRIINRMNEIHLDVRRAGKELFSLPLTALVLLLLFAFWFIIPAMVVGLFFGISYRFSGFDGVEGVNRAMDKASDVAEQIKSGGQ